MMRVGNPLFRIAFYVVAMIVAVGLLLTQLQLAGNGSFIKDHWYFFIIGIFAATVANSTGAGGGIVFMPAFILLGLTVTETLATSFAIQCFGMTSGMLTWLALARSESNDVDHCWQPLNSLLKLTLPASTAGLLVAQQWFVTPFFDVHLLFSGFSIVIGLLMLYRLSNHYRADEFHSPQLSIIQKLFLVVSTFIGGVITCWLSVGVGEILAIVLLMFGFNIRFAVTLAVVVSAVTVWLALPYYVLAGDAINTRVLMFAGPAALLGGFVARHLATAISPLKLKMGLSLWIIFSGFAYLLVQ